jgi:hypothetical protein
MSATAERKTNPAQRVKILGRELERRQEKLAAAESEIEELKAGQQAAVVEALRADPTRSAFQRGGAPAERQRKQAALEQTVAHLRAEILALQGEASVAAADKAVGELSEATKEARRLSRRELELRGKVGEAFAALAEISNDLMATLAARGVLMAEVGSASLLQQIGIFNRESVTAWEQASAPAVDPEPRSFRELLEEALTAATGPRSSDDDPESLRALNRHRAQLGLAAEVRLIPASRQALEEAYPDLRQVLRTAEGGPTGEPTEPPAGAQLEGLAEAGFGIHGVAYGNDGNARPLTPAA